MRPCASGGAVVGADVVVEDQHGIADAHFGVHQFAARAGRTGDLFGVKRAFQEVDILGCAWYTEVGS
jgi:hypothetical protein